MDYTYGKKLLLKRGIAILALAFLIYLLMLFADYPQAVEKYYSQGVYTFICRALHPVFNIFPFSVGDILYIFIIGFLIYTIVQIVKFAFKRNFVKSLGLISGVIIGLETGILIFYLFWGLNYFRPSAAERLKLTDTTFTLTDLQQVTTILIDSANACRKRLTPADLKQNNSAIYLSAINAVKGLSQRSPVYKTYSPDIKPSLLTPVMNYIGTSGYYNPFTSETQINYQMPVFNRPFVACHEMSHQMGFGAEDEANFAGFMIATSSNDRLLRYSAYHQAVGEFMFAMYEADTVLHKQLKASISPAVKADFKQERLYWLSYQNKIDEITGIFYDNFLKVNNQPAGLDTYNQMVALVIALYKKKHLQDQHVSGRSKSW
ncbi:DUF3810 domain-containing protein [Mucilaginibacter segetis]|uniref:DUF3810 domain-containing protein n=1 Tax=Mucilaginibacter segetis TaxID=2793071 RepID=A0A934PR58_9SPHI|nr:DUF3810 domain-containing protein [Mucilaginibacter segetis]MBK0377741.1 DUF3810 domain-containing protein [Mucilaginibacter segetis]